MSHSPRSSVSSVGGVVIPPSSSSPSSPSRTSVSVNASSRSDDSAKVSRAASLEWADMADHSHLAQGGEPPFASAEATHRHMLLHTARDAHEFSDSNADTPEHDEHADIPHPKSSINSSVFVLAASTLGAGILALPGAFSQLGYALGAFLLILVGVTSSYAISLLISTARAVGARTYEDLGHAMYPRFGRRLVVSATLVLIFGSLTAFFVIIADTVTPAVQSILGVSDSFFVKREVLLVIVAICIVFPLCLLRSIHALERWSFLAVAIILLFSILIVIEGVRKLVNGTAAPNSDGLNPDFHQNVHAAYFDASIFQALPIICLAFTCQTMIFPIWNSLAGGGDSPRALAPTSAMKSVANRSLLLCGTLYLPVALFGFFSFGGFTNGDVLNNFPNHQPFYDVVRVLFTLAITIHYPVVHFGFRTAILSTWYSDKTEKQNRVRFWVITCLACLFSLFLALVLPNLSTVFSLTGAVTAFPYCFMFPSLFYLRLHRPDSGVLYLGGSDRDDEESEEYRPLARDDMDATAAFEGRRRSPSAVITEISVSELDGGARTTDGEVYQSRSSSTTNAPLLLAPVRALTRWEQAPAKVLFVIASILWVVSVVVSFKDMVDEFRDHGL